MLAVSEADGIFSKAFPSARSEGDQTARQSLYGVVKPAEAEIKVNQIRIVVKNAKDEITKKILIAKEALTLKHA